MTDLEFREAVVEILVYITVFIQPQPQILADKLGELKYEIHIQRLRHDAGDT